MTSKEAKTHIVDTINGDMNKEYFINELLPLILKDLDRLEELEKENAKLKKAFNKACEMLDWSCPTEQNLIDYFDCENCKDDYKECWKKYFLYEVLK